MKLCEALARRDGQLREFAQHLTDWCTPSHIVHGFFLYAVFRYAMPSAGLWPRLAVVTLVETAQEVAENTDAVIQRYREATVALEFELGIG